MKKIVITEFMDESATDELKDKFTVVFDPTLVDRPDDLIREIHDADAVIVRNRTQIRGELLEAAEKLKAVGRLGVGLDNIDLEACKARKYLYRIQSFANNCGKFLFVYRLFKKLFYTNIKNLFVVNFITRSCT